MKIYALSDSHLGHTNLVTYGHRKDGYEKLILYNLYHSDGDVLIHCGDFCIGKSEYWHKIFMSAARNFKKKILVRGNHDSKSDSWYLAHGWDFVCREFKARYFGKTFVFTHIPKIGLLVGEKNIHGHLHGKKNLHRNEDIPDNYNQIDYFDLAPEDNGYKLIQIK